MNQDLNSIFSIPFDFEDEESTPPPPLATSPKPSSASLQPTFQYPPTLPHDIALASTQEELDDLLKRHSLTQIEYDYISDLPVFRREVSEWKSKIHQEGYGFKLKLRGLAEAYIPELISILYDTSVAPSVRIDTFKYITKCAELEPKKQDLEGTGGAKITIEIANFSSAAHAAPHTINISAKDQESNDLKENYAT